MFSSFCRRSATKNKVNQYCADGRFFKLYIARAEKSSPRLFLSSYNQAGDPVCLQCFQYIERAEVVWQRVPEHEIDVLRELDEYARGQGEGVELRKR